MKQVVVVRAYIEIDNKILLLERSTKEPIHSGQFELPGGVLEIGESLEEALDRELQEEIGRNFKQYSLKHAFSYLVADMHAVVITYNVQASKQFNPRLSAEHINYTWQSKDKLDNINTTKELKVLMGKDNKTNVEENTTKLREVKLYTDGGSRGNPGPSALGYVIYDLEENVVKKGSKYLGITTNNQAEYQAVKVGLLECLRLGAKDVVVYLDSQLVANQMNGIYKVKNRDLWPIHDDIKEISKQFKGLIKFIFVPRALNKAADEMVNIELDNQI